MKSSVIEILFILLVFISVQLFIFRRNRKAILLLLNILPSIIITVLLLLEEKGMYFPGEQFIFYAGLLFYPYTFIHLMMDFFPVKIKNPFLKFAAVIIPASILILLFRNYDYSIILFIHAVLYIFLLFMTGDNLPVKFNIILVMILPTLFLFYYYIYFHEAEILVISLDLMYVIISLTVLYEYSRRIYFVNARLIAINSLNKRLNQIVTRLRQRNDTLKKIISQKDIELLQIARHASLAEVTTGIAHELAQPLTGIKCIAQNMIDDINYDDFDHQQAVSDLGKISSLVDRSASIIDHIRTFSCKRGFTFQQADLNACILNAIELLSIQIKKSDIDLIFVLDDSIPRIYGDNLSLEQLFINFILNSRDAISTKMQLTPDLSGVIKITTTFNEEIVKLIIEDNGSGIPEDIIPKIWTPFFTTKQKGKGTGIGLSLSHRIIKEHNADVSITSSSDGTVFTITFPIRHPQQDDNSQP